MEKWCLFLFIAIFSAETLSLRIIHKRQAESGESSTEDGLEDRYGWNRPNWQGGWPQPGPGLFPGQFPGQWQQQFPGQFPGQWEGRLPNQGQPGQGQPGQGQPGQGQPGQGQPGQGQPGQGQPGQVPTTTQNPNGNGSTTQSSSVQACIRTCPVTAEYNPVCGSDNITYDNPSRLNCAQACGVNVNLLRSSRCTIQSN